MGAVLSRSLGAVVGGIILIGFYFWSFRDLTESKAGLYCGVFLVCVGLVGLLYWRWRSNKLRIRNNSN